MKLWLAALAVTVVNWLMKAGGPLMMGERRLPPAAVRVVGLVAPVLLAGLIVTELGGKPVDWTQLAGVGVAGILSVVRVPLLLAVAAGIALTAGLRLLIG
ncbi:branched-subunit amino acid transport protein AzlD [Kribbella steppae]|uniref:Branched-subunit amino acid transport protein AzlD n=1 Tax=Kribbella steppae TaxID=2512223 RepID=A0A4V2S0L2_9ACTN|nr:AzlD domain-containing protein [Kribbella steppae]TCO33130.1 branched-subunit amino acid transport protein AzlD [Kribbella steppae]